MHFPIAMNQRHVMAGLVPAIHAFFHRQDVDARHKVYTQAGRRPDPGAGHDDGEFSDKIMRMKFVSSGR
jgi:hypothetical protein